MIKIENVVTPSTMQWESVVRGIRNPYNSWEKSDSYWDTLTMEFNIGKEDLKLMEKLANAGDDHGKFLRMLPVICDLTAPLYWWKEAEQYKIGTTTDSCSTMHTVHKKKFELEDFSVDNDTIGIFNSIIDGLNYYRDAYNDNMASGSKEIAKVAWYSMIQLLPSSYNQRRTWSANYQVLRHIYHARKGHRLKEWEDMLWWISDLPFAKELIVGEK